MRRWWGCPRRSKIAQPSVPKRSSVSRRPRALERRCGEDEKGNDDEERKGMGNKGLSDRATKGLKR
jgi:hypothetical protein